jgi:hypothetical protein
MKQQEVNGFKFDMKAALGLLLAELREKKQIIEDDVHNTFKPKWVDTKEVTPYIKTKTVTYLSVVFLMMNTQRCLDTQ